MILRSLVIHRDGPFCGKMVKNCGLREKFHCMLVGFEDGGERLGLPSADRVMKEGERIWVVGEKAVHACTRRTVVA